MAIANSTQDGKSIPFVRNPLVQSTAALTAECVASVLAFMKAVQPNGVALSDPEDCGRMLILECCVAALDTISGNDSCATEGGI